MTGSPKDKVRIKEIILNITINCILQEIWTQTGTTKTFMNLYRYMKMKKDNKQFEEDLKSFTSFF